MAQPLFTHTLGNSAFFSAVTNSWKVQTQNLCKKCPYNRKDYLAKMQQHSARCHCCRVCILEGRWTLYCISFISKLLPKKSIVVAQHLHQTNISNILSVVGRLDGSRNRFWKQRNALSFVVPSLSVLFINIENIKNDK